MNNFISDGTVYVIQNANQNIWDQNGLGSFDDIDANFIAIDIGELAIVMPESSENIIKREVKMMHQQYTKTLN